MGAVVDAHVLRSVGRVITVFHLVRASAAIYLPPPSRGTIIHHRHHHLSWTPNNTYKMPHTPRCMASLEREQDFDFVEDDATIFDELEVRASRLS